MYRARNDVNRHNCLHLFHNKEGGEVIVFDTETTGTDTEKDYIAELAAKKFRIKDHSLDLLDEMDLFIRPPINMPLKATKVNGITDDFLADKPAEKEVFPKVQSFFGERPLVIGHNVMFDIKILRTFYKRQGTEFIPAFFMDTAEFARDIIPPKELDGFIKDNGLDKNHRYRLGTLVAYYGLDEGLMFHRALDDVEATSRLLKVCYREYSSMEVKQDKRKAYISYFYFWKGRNRDQQGIWVKLTDGQTIYYSTYNKAWMSSKVDLSEIDITSLERDILRRCGLSLEEFGKLTEKRWMELKEKRKAEGVRL